MQAHQQRQHYKKEVAKNTIKLGRTTAYMKEPLGGKTDNDSPDCRWIVPGSKKLLKKCGTYSPATRKWPMDIA